MSLSAPASLRNHWQFFALRHRLLILTLLIISGLTTGGILWRSGTIAHALAMRPANNNIPVTTVSGVTFEATTIAPQSIVSAFGTLLATSTVVAPTVPLPTDLGGTFVEVNGVRAPLFFVSVNQINFLIPAGTAPGTATVVVTAGDGTISTGTVDIRLIAPAIVTANGGGTGVPNGQVIRIKTDNSQSFETLAQLNPTTSQFLTRPLDLGPTGEKVFAVLSVSGTRGVPDTDGNPGNGSAENVRVVLGGTEIIPTFLGASPSLAGLEQLNFELPRSLIGRGLVDLAVTGTGFGSNRTEIEFAAAMGEAPPVISGVSQINDVLAGQSLTLTGTFAAVPTDNTIRISGIQAKVVSASSSQLSILVPFGSQSGQVNVATRGGQASSQALTMRTSVSGFVEDTAHQPLRGCTIKQVSTTNQVKSSLDGSFVLPDPSTGGVAIEIDGTTAPVSPPFPKVILKKLVSGNRDNLFDRPISLQQATGESITVGNSIGSGPFAAERPSFFSQAAAPPAGIISAQDQNIIFEIPVQAQVRFPNGATRGTLTVTKVADTRTASDLPPGVFSSNVVQITPFQVSINPGAKLTFPNSEKLASGSKVPLYLLDQNPTIPGTGSFEGSFERKVPGNPRLGSFIIVGLATVSADGAKVETEPDAIKESGMYFIGVRRDSTTIAGRLVDCQCAPLIRAAVRVRGQEVFLDGNGGFVLRAIPILDPAEKISVEVKSLRADGTLQFLTTEVRPVINGLTIVKPEFHLRQELCPVAYDQVVTLPNPYDAFSFRLLVRASGGPDEYFLPPEFKNGELEYIIIKRPVYGSLHLGLKGPFAPRRGPYITYIPCPLFYGSDSFIYTVSNGCVESEPATVIIRLRPSSCFGSGCGP